jgi:hypothetical protein
LGCTPESAYLTLFKSYPDDSGKSHREGIKEAETTKINLPDKDETQKSLSQDTSENKQPGVDIEQRPEETQDKVAAKGNLENEVVGLATTVDQSQKTAVDEDKTDTNPIEPLKDQGTPEIPNTQEEKKRMEGIAGNKLQVLANLKDTGTRVYSHL